MSLHDLIVFANDAERFAALGVACWLVSALALVAERRRNRRSRIDRVGWMPWTGVFLTFAVLGGGLIYMALPGLMGKGA